MGRKWNNMTGYGGAHYDGMNDEPMKSQTLHRRGGEKTGGVKVTKKKKVTNKDIKDEKKEKMILPRQQEKNM